MPRLAGMIVIHRRKPDTNAPRAVNEQRLRKVPDIGSHEDKDAVARVSLAQAFLGVARQDFQGLFDGISAVNGGARGWLAHWRKTWRAVDVAIHETSAK